MVVWVFAGGGESEILGLIPFLKNNYPQHQFERKLPAKKFKEKKKAELKRLLEERRKLPFRNPEEEPFFASALSTGRTGDDLVEVIKQQLKYALMDSQECDLVLILDDLDCRKIDKAIKPFEEKLSITFKENSLEYFFGFAAPEMEAWLIADWTNSFASHSDYKNIEHQLKRELRSRNTSAPSHITKCNVSFDIPESFSELDEAKNCCNEKLSTVIYNACKDIGAPDFSKKDHTPEMLKKISAVKVSQTCPLFRAVHRRLLH